MQRRAPSLQIEHFERLIDIFEKQTNFNDDLPSLVQLEQALVKHAKGLTTKENVEQAFGYWRQERVRNKQPFLRLFWRKPNREDSNSNLVFRSRTLEKMNLRKKVKNEQDSYVKARELRAELCAYRCIVEKLVRREILKGYVTKLDFAEFRERNHTFTAEESRQLQRDEAALRPRLPENLRPNHADEQLVSPPPPLRPEPPVEPPVKKPPKEKELRAPPPEPVEPPQPIEPIRNRESERVLCSNYITEITKLLSHVGDFGSVSKNHQHSCAHPFS